MSDLRAAYERQQGVCGCCGQGLGGFENAEALTFIPPNEAPVTVASHGRCKRIVAGKKGAAALDALLDAGIRVRVERASIALMKRSVN